MGKNKLDFITNCFLSITKAKIVKIPVKLEITKADPHAVCVFENYDEYYNFFKRYLNNVDEKLIETAIYAKGKKGQIIAFRGIIERIIIKRRMEEYYDDLTKDKIEEIHNNGKLTAYDKVKEWEGFDLCAPGDAIGSAAPRCAFFERDCHQCLLEFASHSKEHNPIDFKIINYDFPEKVKKQER